MTIAALTRRGLEPMTHTREQSAATTARDRVPVNLICGSLGVGKTTAVQHLLRTRPAGERWAVLVNEFGLVGLDAALLADDGSAGDVDVREVAGGCICCSAGFLFEVSLALLLDEKPDRLLIEPSGLAAVSGLLDTLAREHIRDRVDVRATVCLLDATNFKVERDQEEVEDQIEAADVLLANRKDLASRAQREDFERWAASLFPAKRHVACIEQGRIPLDLLDLVVDQDPTARSSGYAHGTDHASGAAHEHRSAADVGQGATAETRETAEQSEIASASTPLIRRCHVSAATSTIGWIGWNELVFDSEKVVPLLGKLLVRDNARRVKAVLRTEDGWWSFNLTKTVRDARPTAYRRDSRIEAILEGDQIPDLDVLEQALKDAALVDQHAEP